MKMKTQEWYAGEVAVGLRQVVDRTFQSALPDEMGRTSFGEHVLDIIQGYIHNSILVGANPLPALRKLCPFMDWRYHLISEDEDHASKIVAMTTKCDLFWPGVKHQSIWWYTATRRNISKGEYLSLCGCLSNDFLSEYASRDDVYGLTMQSAYSKTLEILEIKR